VLSLPRLLHAAIGARDTYCGKTYDDERRSQNHRCNHHDRGYSSVSELPVDS
jgi:hypothetical protein